MDCFRCIKNVAQLKSIGTLLFNIDIHYGPEQFYRKLCVDSVHWTLAEIYEIYDVRIMEFQFNLDEIYEVLPFLLRFR